MLIYECILIILIVFICIISKLVYSYRYPLFIVKVEGESMWPELIAGKRYFATSLLKPKVGQYAVFKNPENTKQVFVKKVKNIQDGDYILCGTVPWSNEYLVGLQFILGRVIKWRD